MTAAGISRGELAAGRCDRCHERPGAKFVDGFWSCGTCAALYLDALEVERKRLCLRNWPHLAERV